MSLTRDLVKLIRARTVEPQDFQAAALMTLDGVANALAGRNSGPGRILLNWHHQRNNQSDDPARLAFMHGALTHILETDDLHRASVTHPGCVVIPAAFALAQHRGHGGQQTLTAILQGFEAMSRVGMAVGGLHYKIWHNTATCGPFGSAMAAAHLFDLNDEQCVHALGNAGTQSSGLWQFLDTGAMSKHLHAGRAAESGLLAADLASFGFTGPPEILEGAQGFFAAACPDAIPDKVLAETADRWQLAVTSIKPWPSCRHTHPTIDCALEISELAGSGLAVDQIEQIEVNTYGVALDVCDRASPDNDYAAKFSLQHCVSAALADGAVDFSSFDNAARDRLENFRQKVTVRTADPWASAYPVSWGAEVVLTLKDGQVLKAQRKNCYGDPESALSKNQMTDKARMLLAHGGLNDSQAEELIDSVLAMADDGPVPDLGLLRDQGGAQT